MSQTPEPLTADERKAMTEAIKTLTGCGGFLKLAILINDAIRAAEQAAHAAGQRAMRERCEQTARANYCGSDRCEAVQRVADLIAALSPEPLP